MPPIRSALLLIALCALAACGEPRWLPLAGDDIHSLMFGNTAEGTDAGGAKWTLSIASDGKAVLESAKRGGTGTAAIDGDTICLQLKGMPDGQPDCDTVYASDDGHDYRVYTPDQKLVARFSIHPGNL